jgi:hypothetical protein
MSELKKMKVSDSDIYKLYCLQNEDNKLNGFAIFAKQKIHQKKIQILKMYTSNFVQLGGAINEIKKEFSYEKMQLMQKEFGDLSIDQLTASKFTKGQFMAILTLSITGIAIGAIIGLGIIYWKEIVGACVVLFFILVALFSPSKKEEILFDKNGKAKYKKSTTSDGIENFSKIK